MEDGRAKGALRFTPDSCRLYTAALALRVDVWDAATGKPAAVYKLLGRSGTPARSPTWC